MKQVDIFFLSLLRLLVCEIAVMIAYRVIVMVINPSWAYRMTQNHFNMLFIGLMCIGSLCFIVLSKVADIRKKR